MTTTTPRRLLLTAATAALLLAGTACASTDDQATASSPESTTTVAAERPTEAFDELVAIGDGRLHLRCSGSGDATVLLIAGWDHASGDWAPVEPALAGRSRVCSYDRFGTGTSDAPATPQTFESQVADLHELLDATGEPGPYVVVGHSFGGAEAVTFASTYPGEVVGLVLVDASPATWPETVCSVPAFAAGCALMQHPTQGERLDVFPAFDAVRTITSLGDLPLTVMAAAHRSPDGLSADELARLDALWAEGTQAWARLSTTSSVVTVEDTGHAIQADQPGMVIHEITELLPERATSLSW